jgi:hypothetical protein
MAQISAVFCHQRLLGMVDTDVLVMFFDPRPNRKPSLSNVHLSTLTRILYMPGDFKARLSLTGHRKWESFLGRRPTVLMLCLASTLMMWLMVVLMKGKNATELWSSLCGGVTFVGGQRA